MQSLLKKKKNKNVLGSKLQNQSLVHTHLPQNIQTPSRGFKKKAQEVQYHKLIIATLLLVQKTFLNRADSLDAACACVLVLETS